MTPSAAQTRAATSAGGFSLSPRRRQVAHTNRPATATRNRPTQCRPPGPSGQHPEHRPDRRRPPARPSRAATSRDADDGERAGGDRQQIAEQHRRVGRVAADDRGTDEAADEGQAATRMPWRSDTPMAKAVSAAAPPPAADLARSCRRAPRPRTTRRRAPPRRRRPSPGPRARRARASSPRRRSGAKPNSAARITRTSGER